jgi:hypothetical protein
MPGLSGSDAENARFIRLFSDAPPAMFDRDSNGVKATNRGHVHVLFGDIKGSGSGPRERGRCAVGFFTGVATVCGES